METNCKGANQERVEREERQVCFKSVTMVGNVEEVGPVPPDLRKVYKNGNRVLSYVWKHCFAQIFENS